MKVTENIARRFRDLRFCWKWFDGMPTILRIGPFRFHFYSDESNEPAHIHVRSPDGECKFWLAPVRLARNRGIPPEDVREAERLVFENQQLLIEKFHEYHDR
jgi:hypothetical protein